MVDNLAGTNAHYSFMAREVKPLYLPFVGAN
jgi:hypothetical protein